MARHRHQEFIRFLGAIEAQVPKRKSIHAVVDNYPTHKHPKVREWLARRRLASLEMFGRLVGMDGLTVGGSPRLTAVVAPPPEAFTLAYPR
jgi:hypothetical protein